MLGGCTLINSRRSTVRLQKYSRKYPDSHMYDRGNTGGVFIDYFLPLSYIQHRQFLTE